MRRLIPVLVVGWSTAGCLITDRVEFEDPENIQPLVAGTSPPVNEVRDVDSSLTANLAFQVTVIDENVEDTLDARVFLDYQENPSIQSSPAVLPSGQDERERVVTATFSPRSFDRGCHVVEVIVIDDPSGWREDSNRDVNEGVGKATATWFVLAHRGSDDQGSDISLGSCPASSPSAVPSG